MRGFARAMNMSGNRKRTVWSGQDQHAPAELKEGKPRTAVSAPCNQEQVTLAEPCS